ncbi:MAG: class I adenylate-forming enzyme family protein [Pseudomonadota bacterium]
MLSEDGWASGEIARFAAEAPDTIQIEREGRSYSRADIVSAAARLVPIFAEAGIAREMRVAVVVGDQLRGIEAMLALWSLGASAVFFDIRSGVRHISALMTEADTPHLITDTPTALRSIPAIAIPPRDASEGNVPTLKFPEDNAEIEAYVVSTSGTTGLPKFTSVSHRRAVQAQHLAAQQASLFRPVPGSLLIGSLAFGACLSQWLRVLLNGAFGVSLPLFYKLEELDEALRRREVEVVGLAPVVIRDLLKLHEKRDIDKLGPAFPNLRRLISVGGPISGSDMLATYHRLSPGVRNIYSMTGAGPVAILEHDDILLKPNSVGRICPGVSLRIETETGKEADTGLSGQIIITHSAEKDMRLESGDIGYLDEDGFLFVTGRQAQIACRNSVNINLGEIQNEVLDLDGIRDCLAFSIPGPGAVGDHIALAVETNLPFESIRYSIRKTFAPARRPDLLHVAPRLPRNASEKLALADLRAAAIDGDPGFMRL